MSLPPPADIAAWLTNVVSSVGIVMVNKQLMGKQGMNFDSAVTLCAAHFALTSVFARIRQRFTGDSAAGSTDSGLDTKPRLSVTDIAIFVFVSNFSICSLNISLMVNTVSLYQLAKLAIPPFCAIVEASFFKKTFGAIQLGSMALTLIGVGLVSVAEFNIRGSVFGMCAAMGSVVGSGMQQILCGHYQRKCNMSSNDFLAAVTPWQGFTLFLFGPVLDRYFTGKWVTDFEWSGAAAFWTFLSCSMAVAVNASHFMCLGRFSAVSYQIMGFTKTIFVLFIGFMFFGGILTGQQCAGAVLCLTGMALYGWAVSRKPKPAPAAVEAEEPDSQTNTPSMTGASRGSAGTRARSPHQKVLESQFPNPAAEQPK